MKTLEILLNCSLKGLDEFYFLLQSTRCYLVHGLAKKLLNLNLSKSQAHAIYFEMM